MSPVDWHSSETSILLNPRLAALDAIVKNLQTDLVAHVWVATSGTTGTFKAAALSKWAILRSAASVNAHLESTSSDIWLHALPDFHVGGLGIWARAHLAGARVEKMQTPWDPVQFYSLATATKATLASLVPAQVYDLVSKGLTSPASLRAIIVGGGALPSTLYARACTLGFPLLPSYGLTECASQVATAALGNPSLKLLPHIELKIDSEGFIWIKSPALLTLYYTQQTFIDPKLDGWLKTEDRGRLEGDILTVLGRGSDFVKIGGENVDLAPLCALLDELRVGCGDAALRIAPDDRLGHVIELLVENAGDGRDLSLAFNERVLPYERIRSVQVVDKIARNPLGKVVVSI